MSVLEFTPTPLNSLQPSASFTFYQNATVFTEHDGIQDHIWPKGETNASGFTHFLLQNLHALVREVGYPKLCIVLEGAIGSDEVTLQLVW